MPIACRNSNQPSPQKRNKFTNETLFLVYERPQDNDSSIKSSGSLPAGIVYYIAYIALSNAHAVLSSILTPEGGELFNIVSQTCGLGQCLSNFEVGLSATVTYTVAYKWPTYDTLIW